MTPCKVLLVDTDRRANTPILNALRDAGFALGIVSRLSKLSSVCDRAFDVIAILREHFEYAWAGRLRLGSPRTAVVLVCTGAQPLNFSPPADVVCSTDSPLASWFMQYCQRLFRGNCHPCVRDLFRVSIRTTGFYDMRPVKKTGQKPANLYRADALGRRRPRCNAPRIPVRIVRRDSQIVVCRDECLDVGEAMWLLSLTAGGLALLSKSPSAS